jgi:hydrogenase maturation protease
MQRPKTSFAYSASHQIENLPSTTTRHFAFVREQLAIQGIVAVDASELKPGLFCLTARVENTTVSSDSSLADPTANELLGLASTHTILSVCGGEFVSAIDSPPAYREESTTLRNDGTWPVLVGEEGERQMVLSSPIILYDYPQVAPESVGDWFDATEIDEMLDLRTRTLTDAEKTVMRSVDEHARRLLERTERTETTDLASLHGTLRGLRRIDMANL